MVCSLLTSFSKLELGGLGPKPIPRGLRGALGAAMRDPRGPPSGLKGRGVGAWGWDGW